MKTLWLALLVIAAAAGVAAAQPGEPPPDPYPPPPPQPYPQPLPPQEPAPQVAPPYAYQPAASQLTAEETLLLQRGEISSNAHFGGVVAAVFPGLGVGQAVQGRWSEAGWIFTLGEGASFVIMSVGISKEVDCIAPASGGCTNSNDGEGLFIAGIVGLVAFHVWDVVDAVVGPSKRNTRIRELRSRHGIAQPMFGKRITPYVNRSHDAGVAGVSLSF
jgi:hypothetical protein